MTAKMDLAASRNIAWVPTIDLYYPGEDLPLTGASVKMEIRLYPGASGAALFTHNDIPFEDHAPSGDDPRRFLRIFPVFIQSVLATMPTGLNAPEAGEADAYAYDIVLTYADALQDKLALGSFLLEPGVTLP